MKLSGGLRLGRIAGIDIHMDWSLLIIFFLITFSLASAVFPAWHPDWGAGLNWLVALAAATLFFASVLAHEMSHALVGRRFGMQIRRITLFVFGGMAHLESEPPTWRAELLMALAGPAASLVIGFSFALLGGLTAGAQPATMDKPEAYLAALGPLATLLLWLGPVNILLAVFNLVPGFPLDGGRALRAVMWGITGNLGRATRWASLGGQAFAWLLMVTGAGMMLGMQVPLLGGGLAGGLWLAFIGWFLNNAALSSYRQLLLRESLEDVPVSRLMVSGLAAVAGDLDLETLAEREAAHSGQRCFPVTDGKRLLGLVSVSDFRKRDRELWRRTRVDEVMTPREALEVLHPRDDAFAALERLGNRNVNQLPVVDQRDHFLGLVRREDILQWLALSRGTNLPV